MSPTSRHVAVEHYKSTTSQHIAAFEQYTRRAQQWNRTGHLTNSDGLGGGAGGAVSGLGSMTKRTKPFMDFLAGWLVSHRVQSLVEASCGHWPTGWQRDMAWPRLDYVGVDLLPSMVEDNLALLTRSPSRFGLRLTEFRQADMLEDPLPEADLLLSKDTLIHFPNADIGRLLRRLTACPARFREVLFVHDQVTPEEVAWRRQRGQKQMLQNNVDIPKIGGGNFHPLNLSAPPFSMHTRVIFSWRPLPDMPRVKVVELLRVHC